MTYGDPRVQRWNNELNKVHAELAALKAEHARLREAAENAHDQLMNSFGAMNCVRAEELRAALDSGKGEPVVPDQVIETVICPECDTRKGQRSDCETCGGRGYVDLDVTEAAPLSAEEMRACWGGPPRETFDPELVRALLDELHSGGMGAVVSRLVQAIRDAERK